MAVTGCASTQTTTVTEIADVKFHHPTDLDRAEAALDRLRPSYAGPIVVRVSESSEPAAYSWSDGTICLTARLLHILSDDEICGVIAHELGHLAHAEGGCQGFALGGTRTEDEQKADAVGIMLLRTSGIPPGSLAHALAKVRDNSQMPEDLRRAMTARIGLLPG